MSVLDIVIAGGRTTRPPLGMVSRPKHDVSSARIRNPTAQRTAVRHVSVQSATTARVNRSAEIQRSNQAENVGRRMEESKSKSRKGDWKPPSIIQFDLNLISSKRTEHNKIKSRSCVSSKCFDLLLLETSCYVIDEVARRGVNLTTLSNSSSGLVRAKLKYSLPLRVPPRSTWIHPHRAPTT
ncbi:hypothetical protein NL676_024460 [Syzygium grande]|nr:hypothetical protein NL676_024460 [Syzygium grande]